MCDHSSSDGQLTFNDNSSDGQLTVRQLAPTFHNDLKPNYTLDHSYDYVVAKLNFEQVCSLHLTKYSWDLGWYAEFLLKIILQFLLGKIPARLNFKIILKSLHIGPGIQKHSKSVLRGNGISNGPVFKGSGHSCKVAFYLLLTE